MRRRQYFSIVFQITQECPFLCDICLRHYEIGSQGLTLREWKHIIDVLKPRGLKRLTVTGGEPSILGTKLFDFLRYVHSQEIHTSLSTTGFKLNKTQVMEMNEFLDQLLISIRSLEIEDWKVDFGNTIYTAELFETVLNLLNWIKATDIILEVNTVVHKENIHRVIDLGWQLVDINPDIVWRVENYYANGLMAHMRPHFEVADKQFVKLCARISDTFTGYFRDIRFRTKESKVISPDYFLAQNGDLIQTSNYRHTLTEFNILEGRLPNEFNMIRKWTEYKSICRNWGWTDFT